MSRLDKLLIQGIRSFDDKQHEARLSDRETFDLRCSQVIQFFLPLTLIVGQNGCGKTVSCPCISKQPDTYCYIFI